MPASYHIAQEIQKYNIPDYRPRQTQYVICILVMIVLKGLILSFVGFKMPSRKFAPSSGCDEIVALHLARLRILRDRISRGSFVLTTRRKHTHDRQAIEDRCPFV